MNFRGVDGYDLVGLGGFAAVLYGVAQWSEPAAVVLGGLAALGLGVFGPRLRKGRTT